MTNYSQKLLHYSTLCKCKRVCFPPLLVLFVKYYHIRGAADMFKTFLPFMSTACSQDKNMPVWNFLSRNFSSPDSMMYSTIRVSLTLELFKRRQKICLVFPGGPVQKGLATLLVPSHQWLVVTASKAKVNATKLRTSAREARCPCSSLMVKAESNQQTNPGFYSMKRLCLTADEKKNP